MPKRTIIWPSNCFNAGRLGEAKAHLREVVAPDPPMSRRVKTWPEWKLRVRNRVVKNITDLSLF